LARGLSERECPDAWNLAHADWVEAIPRSYVEAGSRIVLTNTFRANRLALAPYGLADAADQINRAGAEISRRAAGGRALVFGSIGPSGKMLFAGDATQQELQAAFEEQAQALAAGGVDGLVIETMSDLEEARLALAACKSTGLPTVACMVFDSGREKDRTMTGVTPEQAAGELAANGADVVGANCGSGIAAYIALCRRLRDASGRAVWVKPNAGTPEIVDDRIVYRITPHEFARDVQALVQGGAGFVGGCCGTSPDFIQAIRKQLFP
jgi:methionine synthase I (cobalamin-dependent)